MKVPASSTGVTTAPAAVWIASSTAPASAPARQVLACHAVVIAIEAVGVAGAVALEEGLCFLLGGEMGTVAVATRGSSRGRREYADHKAGR